MFGLSLEKLVLVVVLAALVLGPRRLPLYAQRLADTVRGIRVFVDAARARALVETGVAPDLWQDLDPRRYDPRRIVAEALRGPEAETSRAGVGDPEDPPDPVVTEAGRARAAGVGGSSAHPRRRVAVPSASDAGQT